MQGEQWGKSGSSIHRPGVATVCQRCGDFAELRRFGGQNLCAACIERIAGKELRTGQVIGDTFRVMKRIGALSCLMLIAIDLPINWLSRQYELPVFVTNIYYFVTLLAVGAILHLSHQVLAGEERLRIGDAVRTSGYHWARMIGSSWLSGIITLFFLLLLIVPGVLRALSYAIVLPLVLHENAGVSDALAISSRRMQGRRKVAFFAFVVAFVEIFVVAAAIAFTLGVVSEVTGSVIAETAVDYILPAVTLPVHVTSAVLYARCPADPDTPPGLG